MESKTKEEAVKHSEEKYKTLFDEDISGDYIATPSGKFLLCNQAFAKMLGFSCMDEVYKINASALYENKRDRKEFLDQLNKKKKLNLYEHNLVRKDGEIITVLENSIGIFDNSGKLVQIHGYIFDITVRKQAEDKLKKSLVELRNLAAHLQNVREEERTSIARNIHDDMGQILAVIKINLSLIESEIQSKKESVKKQYLLDEFKDMLDIVDNATIKVKKLITELRPEVLDNLGLLEALKWQAYEFEKQNKIKCLYTSDFTNIKLNNEISTAIFRILQEVLTNVSKHSKATAVKINFNKKNDNLVLKINDNGIGFSEKKVSDPNSFGLLGMRERAMVFGGRLEIDTWKGTGTKITLSIPISQRDCIK